MAIEIWSESKILDLINNRAEESIHLEFKDARAFSDRKKKDISQDVSAFANSDGGIIIYGIREEDHIAKELSFINGRTYTKEWLEQVIQGNIQKRIEGVIIHPIRFNGEIEKSIYVVEIPTSPLAPHISSDKKYYRRFNFQSVAMEEYEIRNLYLRTGSSKLEIERFITELQDFENWKRWEKICIRIHVQIINKSIVPSDSYKIQCILRAKGPFSISNDRDKEYNLTILSSGPETGAASISTTKQTPIFPDEILTVLMFSVDIPFNSWLNYKDSFVLETKLFKANSCITSEDSLLELGGDIISNALNEVFN